MASSNDFSQVESEIMVQVHQAMIDEYDYEEGDYNRTDAERLARMYFDASDRALDGFFIDFDNVWTICGYSSKGVAKRKLTQRLRLKEGKHYQIREKALCQSAKRFNENKHMENPLCQSEEQKTLNQNGGQNKETIMLTSRGFCRFAAGADTAQGDVLRDFLQELTARVKNGQLPVARSDSGASQMTPTTTNNNNNTLRLDIGKTQTMFMQAVNSLQVAGRHTFIKLNSMTNYTILGKTKKQLKEERGITRKYVNTREYMSDLQMNAVKLVECTSAINVEQQVPESHYEIIELHQDVCDTTFTPKMLEKIRSTVASQRLTLRDARRSSLSDITNGVTNLVIKKTN